MKKLLAMMLALVMVMSLSVTAFATENAAVETGSITITGVGAESTYEIYKLLDLESYDTDSGAYSYKVNEAWRGFFATDAAKAYFTVDGQYYATWTATSEDDDTVAAFAKLALKYAKENGIASVKSSATEGEFAVSTNEEGKQVGVFSGLALGYYLVDSTMGALCGLTTTNPDAYINAKNGIPTIDKQVAEDSTKQYGGENTADIGQFVEYRVTINVHAGAENYVLYDTMEDGLTFVHDTDSKVYPDAAADSDEYKITKGVWKIEHVVPNVSTKVVDPSFYTVEGITDRGFEIHFTQAFCDHLETNDKVIVYYNAMLNRNAVIAGEGNDNTAVLHFGEGGVSNEDTVTTHTYAFDLVKTDSQNKLLDGAKFKIYDAADGGNVVAVVKMDDNVTYRRARADEGEGIEIEVTNGKVRVVGFDNGTYYLQETVTPEGYNSLATRHKFTISDGNLDASITDNVVSTGSGVHVVNKSGTMLPETGGFGTVLFICFGMFVAVATGVLLVTKKRVSMIQD